MSELGPFYPDDEGSTLTPNPWAWNKVRLGSCPRPCAASALHAGSPRPSPPQVANMLFIESPAGVGFSYSNDKSDYTVGDARTSADLYVFLLGFLKEFPQYANTPFWVSGESYGGHYVPNLANYIAGKNAEGATPQINLQGFLVRSSSSYAPHCPCTPLPHAHTLLHRSATRGRTHSSTTTAPPSTGGRTPSSATTRSTALRAPATSP